jgi:hypothetical protein
MKVNSKALRQRIPHATKEAAAKRSKTNKHKKLFKILKKDHSIDHYDEAETTKIATTAFVRDALSWTITWP